MSDTPFINQITNLFRRGIFYSHSTIELDKIDDEFEALIEKNSSDQKVLFFYNEFRISHIDKLSKKRTQILLGGPFGIKYPNIHSYPLFESADVICLTTSRKESYHQSEIACRPTSLFFDILKRLPKGFKPDFYWDNQVECQHFIPIGIEIAPFPIVASVCHTFLYKSIEQVCELFDLVIPISTFYGNILRKKYPEKIMDLPFGLNWASFDHLIKPEWEKSIDVCLVLEESSSPTYDGRRNRVIELTKKFKEKYGGLFSIYIVDKLETSAFYEILKKSRIVINVTGIHGPYNYRTMEAMCSGSMNFQYDWDEGFFENKFSELFTDGVHGASFNFENFEKKLIFYLENRELTTKIAKEGYDFLVKNFNYKKLYKELIESVNKKEINRDRNISNKIGYHNADMIYYYQNLDTIKHMSFGCLTEFHERWIQMNNLMVLAMALDKDGFGYPVLLATNVSPSLHLKKFNDWSLCCKLHEEALSLVPKEYIWIVEWNFLLLSIEQDQFTKLDLEKMLKILEAEPEPFDEIATIFKYYVNSTSYPDYKLESIKSGFIFLNLELMKVIEDPKKRALLYRDYALKATHYFLASFS